MCDYGGVLTTNVFESFRAFCRGEGLEPDALKDLVVGRPDFVAELRKLERGQVAESEFSQTLATELGITPREDLVNRLFSTMSPDDDMICAVRNARSRGVRTGLVSNSWGTQRYDRQALSELFDTIVISGEVGLHKPEPDIYWLAAGRLGVEPTACVFVDDLRENCEGAEAVGMVSVLHRGAVQTIAELERLFEAGLS